MGKMEVEMRSNETLPVTKSKILFDQESLKFNNIQFI